MTDLFRISSYWAKWFEVRVITEEGAFAEGQVPDDYSGSELTVEVTQRVIFMDTAGHMTEFHFDDFANVMDAERKTGIGADILAVDNETVIESIDASGPSSHKTKVYVRYANFSDQQRTLAEYVNQLKTEQTTVVEE